ncbi:hypothetical protein [Corallococcus llansteffanensis]|uniref:GNAT family N-acetyltransferase n=1 Tax=Corallococcus llansteffanensis TaxID=2316731 RepID=A0A3A8PRB5_9BACT|nr:hypothetical protein [Corallococcus llansteffanensis]RKH56235.1 hypothetical protein D7V93_20640 [Corallococcus llansteffanensis]
MSLAWSHLVTERVEVEGVTLEFLDEPAGRLTREMFFEDAVRLVAAARGWETPQDVAQLAAHYKFAPLLKADLICVAREGLRVLGLCTYRFLSGGGARLLHTSNSSMLPELQGKGIMTHIMYAALSRFMRRFPEGPHYLTLITQSPVVYGAMHARGQLYPALDGSPAPGNIQEIGRFLAHEFNPGLTFDEERFVIRNECQFFYKQVPRYRDPKVNTFVDGLLRYREGDVMVLVLKPE